MTEHNSRLVKYQVLWKKNENIIKLVLQFGIIKMSVFSELNLVIYKNIF